MKRIHRVAALLVMTALAVVIAAMAGAPSAFGEEVKAGAVGGIADAHAGEVVAEAGGSLD